MINLTDDHDLESKFDGNADDEREHISASILGSTWVSSLAIEDYYNLIKKRSVADNNLPTVFFSSTKFYTELVDHGFDQVKTWHKDLFTKDIVFGAYTIKFLLFLIEKLKNSISLHCC